MGSKYNWKFFSYWVEFTPSMYIRVNKLDRDCWEVKFEKWWG